MTKDKYIIIPPGEDWTIEEIYERIDFVVDSAANAGTIEPVLQYVYDLKKYQELAGKSLARFLYRINKNWKSFEESKSDNFKDYMSTMFGIHPHTVERYVRVAKLFEEAPAQHIEKLQELTLDNLYPVANANDQGYWLDEQDWVDYIQKSSPSERMELIREVKGRPPRKSGMSIWLDRRGSLWAFQTEYERKFIGSLEIEDEDELVQKALNRLIHDAKIREE